MTNKVACARRDARKTQTFTQERHKLSTLALYYFANLLLVSSRLLLPHPSSLYRAAHVCVYAYLCV